MAESRMALENGFRHDEVVAGRLERHEIQAEGLSGRSNADTDVGLSAGYRPRDVKMGAGRVLIPAHPGVIHACSPQTLIEQEPRTRALLSIDESHRLVGQIGRLANRLWIPRPDQKAFLPGCKRHHLVGRPFERALEERQIRFAAEWIKQMQAGHMHLIPLQGSEGSHTSHRPAHNGSSILMALQMFSSKKHGWIAAGDRDLLLNRLTIP